MDRYPTQQEIAERAYAIWEMEGRPDGREVEHWIQAERELAVSPEATNDAVSAEASPAPKTRSRKPSTSVPKVTAPKTRARRRSEKTVPSDLH